MLFLNTMLFLAIWGLISVGGAILWGNHCRQVGWRKGFEEGFDDGVAFVEEVRQ